MDYKVSVSQIGEDGKTVPQELILHSSANNTSGEPNPMGSFITQPAFASFVRNYMTAQESSAASDPNEIVAVKFNRHILELLLALPECESLVLTKAKRIKAVASSDMVETVAVIAMGKDNKPLGWNVKTGEVDKEKFASVEWGKGLTRKEVTDTFLAGPPLHGQGDFDFDKFFAIV